MHLCDLEEAVVALDELRGLVGTKRLSQANSSVVQTHPDARIDELATSLVIVGIEGELDQFHIGLNQSGVFQFPELPGVPQPGCDRTIGFRLQIGIFQPSLQVASALLDRGVQSSELIEALAEDELTLSGLTGIGEPAVVAREQFRVRMKRRLCAREIGVAQLLGLLFDLGRRLGVHVADAELEPGRT